MIGLDTNILVHAHRIDASWHERASSVVASLANGRPPWAIPYHCLVEFYGVVTHPGIWRRPSTPRQAGDQIRAWCASPSLRLLSETPGSEVAFVELAVTANVVGPKVHDARIASLCLDHGVSELWTIDRDFSRFPRLVVRNPLSQA